MVNHPGLHLPLQGLDFFLFCVNRPAVRFSPGRQTEKFKLPGLDFLSLLVDKDVESVAEGFEFAKLIGTEV